LGNISIVVSGGENAREIGGLVRTGAQRCAAIATR
jgi:hypothetical protein